MYITHTHIHTHYTYVCTLHIHTTYTPTHTYTIYHIAHTYSHTVHITPHTHYTHTDIIHIPHSKYHNYHMPSLLPPDCIQIPRSARTETPCHIGSLLIHRSTRRQTCHHRHGLTPRMEHRFTLCTHAAAPQHPPRDAQSQGHTCTCTRSALLAFLRTGHAHPLCCKPTFTPACCISPPK